MKDKINRKLNAVILIVTMVIALIVLICEDYFRTTLNYKPFIIFGGLIIVFDFYVILFQTSTKRLITLIPVAGIAGYITQAVGTSCNIWVYTNQPQTFFIAAFMFIFASIAMYGLTTKVLAMPKHSLSKTKSRLFNICWISGLFFFLVVTSQKFKNDINSFFLIYYGFLFVFAIYSSLKLRVSTMISLTLSAWIVGFASEYFGSQAGIWLFEKSNNFPPAYLVGGSWPFEFILHYSLSAMIAKET